MKEHQLPTEGTPVPANLPTFRARFGATTGKAHVFILEGRAGMAYVDLDEDQAKLFDEHLAETDMFDINISPVLSHTADPTDPTGDPKEQA